MNGGTCILGINAHHPDAAAALLVDGEWIAASEEERHRRIKHYTGFPAQAIRFCLERAGCSLHDVDHIAINRDPHAQRWAKLGGLLAHPGLLASLPERLRRRSTLGDLTGQLAAACGTDRAGIRAAVHTIEHHRAHLASAFFPSPFERAAVVSVDGFGDYTSTLFGIGEGNRIDVLGGARFPHSLGHYYLAMTQFLGFHAYGDEYKVMGLAAHGTPRYLDAMRRVIRLHRDGGFSLDLRFFRHHRCDLSLPGEDGQPHFAPHFSSALTRLLGAPRGAEQPVDERHRDLAASVQARYEEVLLHLLTHVRRATGRSELCLAGGCAMNSLANGRIPALSGFERVYVQPAAGDAGGALGAAAWTWNVVLGNTARGRLDHAYLGPDFDDEQIGAALRGRIDPGQRLTRIADEAELCQRVAARIAAGAVVGWFQGRCEWGPRALGNRSILADPRRADMRDLLNLKIKRRESFRPFAPVILREAVAEWFEVDADVPFMTQVLPILADKRTRIPAVTHVDGSGRLQTVTAEQNPRLHRLIRAFAERTGIPLLLNTSFNENEPIVCRPEQAIDCFARTRMDLLVLSDHVLERTAAPTPPENTPVTSTAAPIAAGA